MLANDLADWIKSLNVTGIPQDADGNQIVRVTTLEADLADGVMVKSPLDGMFSTPELPGYMTGNIQVIVRSRDPLGGFDLADRLMTAMTVKPGAVPVDLAGYRLKGLSPTTGEPITYPVNDADLFEHSVNFYANVIRL